jgi:hypothetical protein
MAMPTTAGSIMGWVKLTGAENWQSMTSQGGYRFRLVGSMGVRMFWDGADSVSGFLSAERTLAYNRWYHLAGVYDGTGRSIYIDGSLMASDTNSGVVMSIANQAMYVASISTIFHKLYGDLDEVAVSTTALSAAHIRAAYVNQSSPTSFYGMETEETEGTEVSMSHIGGTGIVIAASGRVMRVIS